MQKILIINENVEETAQLKSVLDGEYEIHTVCGEDERENSLDSNQYSLILVDAVMFGAEDFALLKKLQAEVIDRRLPVILIADLSDTQAVERGLTLGAADCLSRPLQPSLVKARVHTHVRLFKYREDERRQSGMTDRLTGVASRKRYELNHIVKWQEAVRLQVPITICMFDIDKFRIYNETYGYPAGDKVLAAVAGAISARLKRSTDFFARYGGEEFIAILLGGEIDTTFEHLKNIRLAVEELDIPYDGSDLGRITISIGGAFVIPGVRESYDTYRRAAETMLLDAKESGRNQVVLSDREQMRRREQENQTSEKQDK